MSDRYVYGLKRSIHRYLKYLEYNRSINVSNFLNALNALNESPNIVPIINDIQNYLKNRNLLHISKDEADEIVTETFELYGYDRP